VGELTAFKTRGREGGKGQAATTQITRRKKISKGTVEKRGGNGGGGAP